MTTGDIVIVSFPYTDLFSFKLRPAVVVNVFPSHFNDVIVCLISSSLPAKLSPYQILLLPDHINNLKTASAIRVSRVTTIEQNKIKTVIGRLTPPQLQNFKEVFKSLVEK